MSAVSLIFSAGFHLLFITSFVLVFTPLKESFKPEFLFLGSILKQEDLQSSIPKTPSANPWRTFKSTTSMDAHLLSDKTSPVLQIDKPLQPALIKEEKKLLTKSTLGEVSQAPKKRPNPDDLDFDLHLTPYKPLKLETK